MEACFCGVVKLRVFLPEFEACEPMVVCTSGTFLVEAVSLLTLDSMACFFSLLVSRAGLLMGLLFGTVTVLMGDLRSLPALRVDSRWSSLMISKSRLGEVRAYFSSKLGSAMSDSARSLRSLNFCFSKKGSLKSW